MASAESVGRRTQNFRWRARRDEARLERNDGTTRGIFGKGVSIKLPFTGGCQCGAVRYECTAEPIMMFKCHCRDCQQVTGGGFVPGLLVPASAFRLTKGELCYHFTPSLAGGKHKRGFCADC